MPAPWSWPRTYPVSGRAGPILARPVGIPERVWRWGQRNPVWMTLVAAVTALLLVIAVGGSVGLVVLGRALRESEANRRDSERHRDRAVAGRAADRGTALRGVAHQARANSLSRRPGQRFASLKTAGGGQPAGPQTRPAGRAFAGPAQRGHPRPGRARPVRRPDLGRLPEGFVQSISTRTWRCTPARMNVAFGKSAAWPTTASCTSGPGRPGRRQAFRGIYFRFCSGRQVPCRPRGEESNRLQVWGLTGDQGAERTPVLVLTEQNVICFDFHPSEEQVVLVHEDGVISLHDLRVTGVPAAARRCPGRDRDGTRGASQQAVGRRRLHVGPGRSNPRPARWGRAAHSPVSDLNQSPGLAPGRPHPGGER